MRCPDAALRDTHDDIKSGRRVHLNERGALDLVARLRLPVPHIHDVQQILDGEVSTCKDFVEGRALEETWPDIFQFALLFSVGTTLWALLCGHYSVGTTHVPINTRACVDLSTNILCGPSLCL